MEASQNDQGQWRLATGTHNCGEVKVYRENCIRSGTVMGPFCITSQPSLVIEVGNPIKKILFVGTDSPYMVGMSYSKVVNIWDALLPSSSGACIQTVRSTYANIRTICCSKSLLFTATKYSDTYEKKKEDEEESRSISVWPLRKGSGPSVKLASLKPSIEPRVSDPYTKDGKKREKNKDSIVELVVMRERSILIASHEDGTVNLWQYDDDAVPDTNDTKNAELNSEEMGSCVTHLRTFQISNDHSIEFFYLLIQPNSTLYIANMYSVFAFDLSAIKAKDFEEFFNPTSVDVTSVTRCLGKRGALNCGYCGLWYFTRKPALCGGCKKVSYCNATCQKEAWKEHKKDCKKKT
jgi:hypothetical protein